VRPRLSFFVALALVAALSACGREGSGTTSALGTKLEWKDFYGIQYQAPPGTDERTTNGTLPGPGGLGGVQTDERPSVTLSMTEPHRFYVEIVKPKERVSLEGMKYVLPQLKATNIVAAPTSAGWDLTYDTQEEGAPTSKDGGSTSKTHIIYVELAGGNYQCTYGEVSCSDVAAAESICRSMRAKAARR
jgi:hypothetical protein